MKKFLAFLMAAMMLLGAVSAFAEAPAEPLPIKMGQVVYAAHGTHCFAVITAAIQGETIVALATNIGGRGARTAGENLLYVLTYNPSRQGRKGSVYVYQFYDDTLVKAYEGVVDKPVAMLYKYRIS